MSIIQAEGLSLTYSSPLGHRVGVGTSPQGLSFEVKEGEIFGIIGPDGAGKTTLFRILCSLLKPHRGSAVVAGCDVVKDYKKLRTKIGYMPGVFSLYGDLTVEENMDFFAAIYGTSIAENYHLVKDIYTQIEPFKKRKARNLSGGMKQKLALSCALIHSPEVLFLDEPTTGIDPISRVELWEMLKRLSKEGVTVVASTAYMEEAGMCDRLAYMSDGQFIGLDSPVAYTRGYPYRLYRVRGGNRLEMLETLGHFSAAKSVFSFGEDFHVSTSRDIPPGILESFLKKSLPEERTLFVEEIAPTLEDAFLRLNMEGAR